MNVFLKVENPTETPVKCTRSRRFNGVLGQTLIIHAKNTHDDSEGRKLRPLKHY